MEQLYLFEILVDKIVFGPMVTEVPNKNDIKIAVNIANLIYLEVASEDMRGFTSMKEQFNPVLQIGSGKSQLFPCLANDLYKIVTESPVQICIGLKYEPSPFGQITIPWNGQIIEMVDKSRTNPNDLVPVSFSGTYEVVNDGQTIVGEIDVFIRLSCLGPNVQTQFQILQRQQESAEISSKKYLFKSSNAETTFQAQKYGPEESPSDILPVAPIFSPADSKNWYKKGYLTPDDMTAENLNKILCKNKDCPGVQKFKQYGLGPAATGKGLGTVYGKMEVPISYGLSQTYGTIDNYGPYGIYTRPINLDQPYIPKDLITCNNTAGCVHCGSHEQEVKRKENKGPTCCCCNPLRLTGGAPVEDENKFPEPMVMCKDLMQSYDKVLNAYKKALGPCGRGTCPFSQNVVAETCKKLCPRPPSESDDTTKTEQYNLSMKPADLMASGFPKGNMDLLSACGTPSCPHTRKASTNSDKTFKNKQMKSACGSPTCPYTKKKLGTATDEDMIELQLMDGPSIAQACGAPKCPFPRNPPLPPLEPIHWDCPDPLPKGPCRNPQCPLKPPELRYNIVPTGPCGNTECPYASPAFCGEPDCPFGPPQSCPYADPPPICPFPMCPLPAFPPPPRCPLPGCNLPPPCGGCCCSNPGCPANPPTCGDQFCPLNPPPRPCPAARPGCPYATPCGGPTCPFAQPRPCGNPICPFATKLPSKTSTICSNPDCPFVTKKESPCFVPSSSICGNPECPYATKKESPCYMPVGQQDICENPDCPYKSKGDGGNNGVMCENPECPYKTQEDTGSSVICDNPECPYRQQSAFPVTGSICGNPECPFATQKESPCYIPAKNSICSNPNCPYAVPSPIPPCGGPCAYPLPCSIEIGGAHLTVEVGDADCGRGGGDKGETESTIMHNEREIMTKKGSNITSQSAPVISQQQPVKPVTGGSASEKAIPHPKGGKKRKRRGKYLYKLGDLYPGVHIGHRECVMPGRNVPSKMGWLWNIHVPCLSLKPRIGWRPGAVGRTVARKIIAHRKAKGLKLMEPLTPKSSKKKMKTKYSEYESDSDATVAPKPTLQIKKREGAYFITMNPLKDPKTIEDNENPYMDCTPMQFKITKNKLQEDGKSCYCGDEDDSSSSDSELDVEFTPPAGVIRPERLKRKKNVVHTDTQYCPEDFSRPKTGKDKKGGKGGKGGKGRKGGKGGKGGKKGKK